MLLLLLETWFHDAVVVFGRVFGGGSAVVEIAVFVNDRATAVPAIYCDCLC